MVFKHYKSRIRRCSTCSFKSERGQGNNINSSKNSTFKDRLARNDSQVRITIKGEQPRLHQWNLVSKKIICLPSICQKEYGHYQKVSCSDRPSLNPVANRDASLGRTQHSPQTLICQLFARAIFRSKMDAFIRQLYLLPFLQNPPNSAS